MSGPIRRFLLLSACLLAVVLPGCSRRDTRPNIVIVVLDTLRRDYTGVDAGPGATSPTPTLDRLAAEGTNFTRVWSAASWTVPSHASIFTGLLPSGHGCNALRPRFDPAIPTAAEALDAGGYATAAFFSNPWLTSRATGLLRGFAERQEARIGGLSSLTSSMGDQGGRRTLDQIARWLQDYDGDDPVFLFANILEAHLPYDPPRDYRSRHLADLAVDDRVPIDWGHEINAGARDPAVEDWDRVRRLYAGDANFADRFLAGVLNLVRRHLDWENTVVIVTSDHGENLGEHGLAEHQFSVHETLLSVPLVIHAPPALLAPGRRDDPVSLTDLYATVLDLAGVDAEPPPTSRSLLPEPPAGAALRPVVSEYAGPNPELLLLLRRVNEAVDMAPLTAAWRTVRQGDLRLSLASDGRVELHDLAADPGQERNLAEARPDDVARLRELLAAPGAAAWLQPQEDAVIDEATRRQLESLGYVN